MIKESFINEAGEVPQLLLRGVNSYLERSIGKLITISIEVKIPTRSMLQNKYYWGVIISYLSKELGYEPEVVHDYMKKLFLGYAEYDFPDGATHHVLKSTTDQTTIEIEEYFGKIRNWAGSFLDMYIPQPNESPFNYLEYK